MSTILLVEARFYPHLNDMLLAGARRAVESAGHKHETMTAKATKAIRYGASAPCPGEAWPWRAHARGAAQR